MSVISNLDINLRVLTGQFTKGLDAAIGTAKNFGSRLSGVATGVAGAVAALVTGGVARIGDIAKVGSAARALGVDTEWLSAMSQAAGGNLEGLSHAVLHMGRSLSEAREGSQSARQAFASLGLNWQELRDQNPAQQFMTVAGAISRLGNQGDRVNAAMNIFGRQGVELLPMISRGMDGISQAMERARQLGLTFTNEQARGAMAAQRAMGFLHQAWTGIYTQVAVRIAPIVEALFGAMNTGFVMARDMATSLLQALFGLAPGFDIFDLARDLILAVEYQMIHWKEVAALVWASLKLGAVRMFEDFKTVLTNFPDLFVAAFQVVSTIVTNFFENMRRMGSALWDWISRGFQGTLSFERVDFTAGAQGAMARFRNALQRPLTDTERQLTEQIDGIMDNLGGGFDAFRQERNRALRLAEAQVPTAELALQDRQHQEREQQQQQSSPAQGLERGTMQAFEAILAARRSAEGNAQERIVAEQRQTNNLLRRIITLNEDGESIQIAAI